MFLAGFGLGRRAIGVLEPLEAGALYLRHSGDDGSAEVCLVTVDCIGLTGAVVDRIRERVTAVAPESVVICATHTHAAPDTMGMWGPGVLGTWGVIPRRSGVDSAWLDTLVQRVAGAVDAARAAARPARLRVAAVEVDPTWTRNDRKGGGRFDHTTVLAADDAETGERRATLLNFASHPEALWENNRYISPDFVGPFRRHLRALSPGLPLYFSGPLGGMLTPNVPPKSGGMARQSYIEDLGRHLAERAVAALADAQPMEAPALRHRRRQIHLENANWQFRLLTRFGLIPARTRDGGVDTEVHHLRVGDLELVTAPGEVLPELGHRLRARLSAPHRMLLCLGCDELGYILEPEMFDEREYRYERSMSLGRPTAEALLDATEELLA